MSINSETPSAEVVDNSFWGILREALRGSSRDFTEGPIGRAIFILAVPMILEMAGESLFAIVDIFFVAKLGADAVATVVLTHHLPEARIEIDTSRYDGRVVIGNDLDVFKV